MIQNPDCTMLVCTCNAYDILWPVFFKYLKMNWPEFNMPIVLNSEGKTFEFDGYNITTPNNIKKGYTWSERLYSAIKSIDTEYILFTLDDFILTEKVDNQTVAKLLEYMRQDERMGFVCMRQELRPDSSVNRHRNAIACQYPELHRCLSGMPFRITTQTGLWRKSYLLKILRARENAWQFEVWGTFRSRYYKERIYDVNEPLFIYPAGGLLWGGKVLEDYINLFPSDLINPIIEKHGTTSRIAHRTRKVTKRRTWRDAINLLLSLIP